jgi:hypothetical protein
MNTGLNTSELLLPLPSIRFVSVPSVVKWFGSQTSEFWTTDCTDEYRINASEPLPHLPLIRFASVSSVVKWFGSNARSFRPQIAQMNTGLGHPKPGPSIRFVSVSSVVKWFGWSELFGERMDALIDELNKELTA